MPLSNTTVESQQPVASSPHNTNPLSDLLATSSCVASTDLAAACPAPPQRRAIVIGAALRDLPELPAAPTSLGLACSAPRAAGAEE